MLNTFTDLRSYPVCLEDGAQAGTLDDLYFDDRDWSLRYLVVDVGGWFSGRQALLGITAAERPDTHKRIWPTALTEPDLRSAPAPQAEPTVAEREEMAAWHLATDRPYLTMSGPGVGYTPHMAERHLAAASEPGAEPETETHLRSMDEVSGYSVTGRDDGLGTVADFLVNPLDWQVRYLVVDTGTWLPGRRAVLSTEWVTAVLWSEQRVEVDVPRHLVETSPEIEDLPGLQRSEEESLFLHYAMPVYWSR